MDDEAPSQAVVRAWLLRGLIVAVIVIAAVWIAASVLSGVPHTILVDDEPIVTVESKKDARAVIDRLRASALEDSPSISVRFSQKVRYRPAAEGAELADASEALEALRRRVAVEMALFCVVVNDMPVVGLAERIDAEQALDDVVNHYEGMIKGRDVESLFKERVFIEMRYVDPSIWCRTAADAVRALTTAAEEPTYHTIVRGDRVMRLARDYGVSFAELEKLNPSTNLDQIVEGDRLLIRRATPPVTVVSRALLTKTTTVTPPPGAGRRSAQRVGKREMEVLETYENGRKISEEVISQRTTWGSL